MRELASRRADGIAVQLMWDPLGDRVLVRYHDERAGDAFVVVVPGDRALDAFHHPHAYRPERPRAHEVAASQ